MYLIVVFVLFDNCSAKVFYLGVEMALIDRSYYSEQFDVQFVIFGLVHFSLWQNKVGSSFSILFLLFFLSLVRFKADEHARARTRCSHAGAARQRSGEAS